jgi:hypothetical protein
VQALLYHQLENDAPGEKNEHNPEERQLEPFCHGHPEGGTEKGKRDHQVEQAF